MGETDNATKGNDFFPHSLLSSILFIERLKKTSPPFFFFEGTGPCTIAKGEEGGGGKKRKRKKEDSDERDQMRRKSSIIQTPASQFMYYCMQRGPITTNVQLLELLGRCGEKTVTAQEIRIFAAVWSESSGNALGKTEFLQILDGVHELQVSGSRYIGEDATRDIFFALSSGAEVLPTLALRRALAAVGIEKLQTSADYFSQGSLWSFVSTDGTLSRVLLEKMPLLLEGAAIANTEGFLPTEADEADAQEEEDRIVERIANALGQTRLEIALAVEKTRRAAALQQHHKKQKKTSYFAPQVVAEMFADVDAEIPLMKLGENVSPLTALEEVDRRMTSQVVVSRVSDLRKHRQAREERLEARQRKMIQTAVYEANILHTDSDGLAEGHRDGSSWNSAAGSSRLSGSVLCAGNLAFLEGIGEKASRRLYPHHQAPDERIQTELARRLGLEIAAIKERSPSGRSTGDFSGHAAISTVENEREEEALRELLALDRTKAAEKRLLLHQGSQAPPSGSVSCLSTCPSHGQDEQRGTSNNGGGGGCRSENSRRPSSAVAGGGGGSSEAEARNEIKGFFFSNAPRTIAPNFHATMPKYAPPQPTPIDLMYKRLGEPATAAHLQRRGGSLDAIRRMRSANPKHNTTKSSHRAQHDVSGVSSSTTVSASSSCRGPFTKADIFHQSQILLCDARDALGKL